MPGDNKSTKSINTSVASSNAIWLSGVQPDSGTLNKVSFPSDVYFNSDGSNWIANMTIFSGVPNGSLNYFINYCYITPSSIISAGLGNVPTDAPLNNTFSMSLSSVGQHRVYKVTL